MIDLDLDDATYDELLDTLVSTHAYKVKAELHDRAGNVKQNLTPYLHSDAGQIDVDADFSTGRMLSLDLWDPNGDVRFDDAAAFLSRTIAIDYAVKIESQEEPIIIPAGRFPIVNVDPQGPLIKVNGVGRALLCQGALLVEHTIPKGHLVTNAITTALVSWAGLSAANLQLPTLTDVLPDALVTDISDTPWSVARALAGSIGYALFFDGRGRVQMRQRPTTPCFDFTQWFVTSFPTMSMSLTDSDGLPLPNVCKVNGAPGIHVIVPGDPRSPISARNLAVNEVPWYRLTKVHNDHIRTEERAKQVGEAVLARAEEVAVQINFDAVPIPLFDEGDCVSVEAYGFAANFQMSQFTLPLAASGPMTVGKKRQLSYAGASARWV